MTRQFAFAAVLLAFSYSAVLAADQWIGRTVFWKHDAKAKIGNEAIKIELVPFPSTVEDVNGEWLWLGSAWVRKSDVLLREDALDYYIEQIRRNPSSAILWLRRGMVWNVRGEFDNSIKDYSEAIRLDPKYAFAYNASAWLRATCPDEHYRDGKKAVANATTACKLSAWEEGEYIDTLAAAYAESGDFPNAIKWQEKAIALATKESEKHLWRERLELYKAGEPYREDPTNVADGDDRLTNSFRALNELCFVTT